MTFSTSAHQAKSIAREGATLYDLLMNFDGELSAQPNGRVLVIFGDKSTGVAHPRSNWTLPLRIGLDQSLH